MTHAERKTIMYQEGRRAALDLQARAPEMDGTQIIAEETKVPAFDPDKDYSGWPVGAPVADGGQVWTLIQPHNAADYDGRPSTLRALWGLAHTTDPAKAKPWVAPCGTSGLYMAGECCTYPDADGVIRTWRNLYGGNAYPPLESGVEDRWEAVA